MQPELHALIARIAEITSELKKMRFPGHIGRYNRIFEQRTDLFDQIDAHPERFEALRALLRHPDPEVQLTAAWRCGWKQVLLDEAERTAGMLGERRDDIGSSARNWFEMRPQMARGPAKPKVEEPKAVLEYRPKPAGCTSEAAAALIEEAFPGERAATIRSLLRPAIGLWPRAADPLRTGSSFGGLPSVPPGWEWPFEDGEPLLFLAQIDCAAVAATAGPTLLPEHGLLLFFGDYNTVHGCGPYGSCSVQHLADLSGLAPAAIPSIAPKLFPRCDLDAYTTVGLPDPASGAIARLGLSEAEIATYRTLRERLASHGTGDGWEERNPSKLFGWPDLVQGDLEWEGPGPKPRPDEHLLLQIGWYHDGTEWQGWDPGGSVYFTIEDRWLRAGRFDHADIEMQCT